MTSYKNRNLTLSCMPLTYMMDQLELDAQKVVDWYNFCRKLCIVWSQGIDIQIAGINEETSAPKIVEIDESLFFWTIALCWRSRTTSPGVRRCRTLLKKMLPCFCTDPGQVNSRNFDQPLYCTRYTHYERWLKGGIYSHCVINHSLHFVHLQDSSIHTQNIVSLRKQAKKISGMRMEPLKLFSNPTYASFVGCDTIDSILLNSLYF